MQLERDTEGFTYIYISFLYLDSKYPSIYYISFYTVCCEMFKINTF